MPRTVLQELNQIEKGFGFTPQTSRRGVSVLQELEDIEEERKRNIAEERRRQEEEMSKRERELMGFAEPEKELVRFDFGSLQRALQPKPGIEPTEEEQKRLREIAVRDTVPTRQTELPPTEPPEEKKGLIERGKEFFREEEAKRREFEESIKDKSLLGRGVARIKKGVERTGEFIKERIKEAPERAKEALATEFEPTEQERSVQQKLNENIKELIRQEDPERYKQILEFESEKGILPPALIRGFTEKSEEILTEEEKTTIKGMRERLGQEQVESALILGEFGLTDIARKTAAPIIKKISQELGEKLTPEKTTMIQKRVGEEVGTKAFQRLDKEAQEQVVEELSGEIVEAEAKKAIPEVPEIETPIKEALDETIGKEVSDTLATKAAKQPEDLKTVVDIASSEKPLAKGITKPKPDTKGVRVVAETLGDDTANVINRLGKKDLAESLAKGDPKALDELGFKVPKKIVPQKFRLDKLNLKDDLSQDVSNRLEAAGLDKRKVRTFEDMQAAAQELGVMPEDLLKESATGRITDKEVVGLRELINNNSQFIEKATRQLDEPKFLKDKLLSSELETKIKGAETQIDSALKKLVKGGTEAGRTVAAFRILAKNTLDPTFWMTKAQKELGNKDLTGEMKTAIKDLIDNRDRNGLAQFISMLREPTLSEKATSLWKAGLLTSPSTHAANILGNTAMAGLDITSGILGSGIDAGVSLFTKKRSLSVSPTQAITQFKGLKGARKDALEFMKTGTYKGNTTRKFDMPRETKFKNRALDLYTKAIFRSLGAEDVIFKGMATQRSLENQARVLAKNEGLAGKAFKERVAKLLENPTNDMALNAIDEAERATFQNKNPIGDFISSMKAKAKGMEKSEEAGKRITGMFANAALEILAPFTNTPTNVVSRIADYSPIGALKAIGRLAIPGFRKDPKLQEKISKQLGQAVTGSSIMALGYKLAKDGKLTGNAPEKKSEREAFYAEKQPFSIKVGDKWLKIDRLSPFGNILTLGADLQRIAKEKKGLGLITTTGAAGLKALTEQTFLKGVAGGLKAITEPEKKGEKFVEQTIASTMPTIVGKVARAIDPNLRITEGVKEAIQARVPGLTQALPKRRDIFGEPVKRSRLDIVSPVAIKEAKDEPILRESERLGVPVTTPSQTINGIKLDNREYDTYQRIQGKLLKKVMTQLIESPEYQGLPESKKEDVFDDTMRDFRREINNQVFPALMIERYNLPENTNPGAVNEVIKELRRVDGWNELDEKKKGDIIGNVLTKLQ